MSNIHKLPLIHNKTINTAIFAQRHISHLKCVCLNTLYNDKSDRNTNNKLNPYFHSIVQSHKIKLDSEPYKNKRKTNLHKAFYDTITEEMQKIDNQFKNCEKKAKRIITIGDNNIKETQRFKHFSKNLNITQNEYKKHISYIFGRISIYSFSKNNISKEKKFTY